jgi:hypothetical protein
MRAAMALHLSPSLREDNSQAKIHKKHLKKYRAG